MHNWRAKINKSATKIQILDGDSVLRTIEASDDTFAPYEAREFATEIVEKLKDKSAAQMEDSEEEPSVDDINETHDKVKKEITDEATGESVEGEKVNVAALQEENARLKTALNEERMKFAKERKARRGLAIAKELVASGNLENTEEAIRNKIAEVTTMEDKEITRLERKVAGESEFETVDEAKREARRYRRIARIAKTYAEEAQEDGNEKKADYHDAEAVIAEEKATACEKAAMDMQEMEEKMDNLEETMDDMEEKMEKVEEKMEEENGEEYEEKVEDLSNLSDEEIEKKLETPAADEANDEAMGVAPDGEEKQEDNDDDGEPEDLSDEDDDDGEPEDLSDDAAKMEDMEEKIEDMEEKMEDMEEKMSEMEEKMAMVRSYKRLASAHRKEATKHEAAGNHEAADKADAEADELLAKAAEIEDYLEQAGYVKDDSEMKEAKEGEECQAEEEVEEKMLPGVHYKKKSTEEASRGDLGSIEGFGFDKSATLQEASSDPEVDTLSKMWSRGAKDQD